ncbi:MAG: hypothetical protein FWC26_05220 [Fibromonadales bacterium]|nr:hypothetical protein [Fibromonadales bacterium]
MRLCILFLLIGLIGVQAYADEEREAFEKELEAQLEAERVAILADFVKKIRKMDETQVKNLLDSLRAKEMERRSVVAAAKTNVNLRTEFYWTGNGDETGIILFKKLSDAGLKIGGCYGNGFNVAASKPSCKIVPTAMIRCTYTPQITITTCDGSLIDIQTFGQTFSGINKNENVAKQRMLEHLQNASFAVWVNQLQSMKK